MRSLYAAPVLISFFAKILRARILSITGVTIVTPPGVILLFSRKIFVGQAVAVTNTLPIHFLASARRTECGV
jgi:hypothetical protein